MTPEEKQLLQKTLELVQENNKMLHHVKRMDRISMILRLSYWIIIIGISLGAVYFLQPYIDGVLKAYKGVENFIH